MLPEYLQESLIELQLTEPITTNVFALSSEAYRRFRRLACRTAMGWRMDAQQRSLIEFLAELAKQRAYSQHAGKIF